VGPGSGGKAEHDADVIFGFGQGAAIAGKQEGLWKPYTDPPAWRVIQARDMTRALSLQPKVLLLAEPLPTLDADLRVQMRAEIKRLKQELNQTVVFVKHNEEEAISVSDQVMVMDQGRILQGGSPDETFERPATASIAGSSRAIISLEGVSTDGTPGLVTIATPLGILRIRRVVEGVRPGKRVVWWFSPNPFASALLRIG
jgi:hypothetical protein